MIQVGIIGGGGYVAGELIRCLVHHPQVQIDFVLSGSQAGSQIENMHQDMFSVELPTFASEINPEVDVVFLCLGHGKSRENLDKYTFASHTKIIDLGNDFRLKDSSSYQGKTFVYGLVDRNKEQIKSANHVANPGCFATAIQQAILPLVSAQWLKNDVHIHAITGSTGAGQSLSATSHFSWRQNNLSIYKAFTHQHLGEIGETIASAQSDYDGEVNFLPVRGDFTRGIFATVYTYIDQSEAELKALYETYYQSSAFTFVTDQTVHLKQVVNTNNSLVQVQKINGKLLVTSVIDNLLRGAAGQAIHNMNLMCGLEETAGLQFKANYF